MTPVVCPYCDQHAALVLGSSVYPHRADLNKLRFYICRPCDAWVGCHGSGVTPLGRLANAELRRAKMAAHAAFDPLWKRRTMKRSAAYKWLADSLAIDPKDCHIGMFDVQTCERVVELCRAEMARKKEAV
jgi:hypothetical protein